MEKFAEKVLKLLEAADATQAKVARAIDVDPSQFAKWLKGKGTPSPVQLLALARYLGVTTDYLVDDAQEKPPAREGLTEGERAVLKAYRDSGMEVYEALKRLGMRMVTTHDSRPG
jgi:transcriptional regulator with XRE-family HTH domain